MKNTCSACGYENEEKNQFIILQGKRGKTEWQKCSRCKSYFCISKYDKNLEIQYTSTSTSWGIENSGKSLNVFKGKMFEAISSLIHKFYPPPANLLDIGCSYGGFLLEVKKLGYKVEGFDIVQKAVEYVSNSLKIKASECFSITDYDHVLKQQFDIITVLDCNYYWNDQPRELKEIYKRINNKGLLVMRIADKSKYLSTAIFLNNFSFKLSQLLMRYSVNDHRFSMPLKSFLELLESTGFKIEYISSRYAIHSKKTKLHVKFLFIFGGIIRKISGSNFSPGYVVIARKI